MWTSFNNLEIEMTLKQAESCSHPGDCEPDVRFLMEHPLIKRQRRKIDPELIRQELSEYGAWEEEELADDDANWQRILWLGANDISEENFMKRSERA